MKAKDFNRVQSLLRQIMECDRSHRSLKKTWEEGNSEWDSPIPHAVQVWLSLGTWSPSSTNQNGRTSTFHIHLTDQQMQGILLNYNLARAHAIDELHSLGVTDIERSEG